MDSFRKAWKARAAIESKDEGMHTEVRNEGVRGLSGVWLGLVSPETRQIDPSTLIRLRAKNGIVVHITVPLSRE
jgi:hypothetical protein